MCHYRGMSCDATLRTNTDVEITSRSQDQLNRRNFADRVATRMVRAGAGPSVVFGLAGPWGSGKSSTLNMIEEQFKREFSDEWIVTRLTPWSATDNATLFDEFYSCVASAMPNTEPGKTAARKLHAMAPVGVAIGKAVGRALIDKYIGEGATNDISEAALDSLADAAGEFRIDDDAFVTKFARVSAAIRAAKRKVLVIVDDVDRLHVDELLSLFKAVRLLGRFDSVHYVLSYDETTIVDVLQCSDIAKGNRDRASAYLEKIIQYPFLLPPIQQVQLRDHIRTSLTEVAVVHNVSLEVRHEDRPASPLQTILQAIPDTDLASLTLRTINRLASQVDILLTLVDAREVDFVDAVLITFLRLHYRDLYGRLPRWKNELTGLERMSFTSRESVDWAGRIADVVGVDENDPSVTELHRLLSTLFPRVGNLVMSSGPDGCRLYQSDYFPRYFTFGIPVIDVSDVQIREEFETLCKTGEFPPDSTISATLGQSDRWSPVLGKVRRNLGAIGEASPEMAFAATLTLGDSVLRDTSTLSGWLPVAALLLERAITAVDDSAQAASFVDTLRRNFGLVPTAQTLGEIGRRGEGAAPAVVLASNNFRDEVLAVCKRDLTSDVSSADSRMPRLLDFLGFLDQDLFEQLRRFAAEELADGRVSLHQLAARFLRLPESRFESETPYIFMSQAFADVIPGVEWSRDGIPEGSSSSPILADGSLEDRINFSHKLFSETPEAGGALNTVAQEEE